MLTLSSHPKWSEFILRGGFFVLLLAAAVGTSRAPLVVLAGGLGLLAFAVLLQTPPWSGPTVLLLSFVLLPKYVSLGFAPLTLPLFGVVFCLARREPAGTRTASTAALISLVVVAGWTVVRAMQVGPERPAVAAWTIHFLLLVVLVAWIPVSRKGISTLRSWWLWVGTGLACYAAIEVLVLRANPLFDWAYQSASPPMLQVWSVYRATTTLGHPLVNGLFFATAFAAAVSRALALGGARRAATAAVLLGGVFLTASRGAVVAAGCGALAAFFTERRSSARTPRVLASRRRWLPLLAGGILAMLLLGGSVAARTDSVEAARSSELRGRTLDVANGFIDRTRGVGVGPGLADISKRADDRSLDRQSGIENSWLQILVALGVPGAVLIGTAIIATLAHAFRAGDSWTAGVLVAYTVAAAGFNLIEAHLPSLCLLGLIVAGAGVRTDAPPTVATKVDALAEGAGR